MDKEYYRNLNLPNGYQWFGFENGLHLFQTGDIRTGYKMIKARPDDIVDGTIHEMCEMNLSRAGD